LAFPLTPSNWQEEQLREDVHLTIGSTYGIFGDQRNYDFLVHQWTRQLLLQAEVGATQPDKSWKFLYCQNAVTVMQKSLEHSSQVCVKSVGSIRAEPRDILKYLISMRGKEYCKFDCLCRKASVLCPIGTNNDARLLHLQYEAMPGAGSRFVGLIKKEKEQKRDFCVFQHFTVLDVPGEGEVHLVLCRSVDYRDCDRVKDSIRGELKVSGWVLRAMPGSKGGFTEVTYVTHAEMKGYVPSWLQQSVSLIQPMLVNQLKLVFPD